MTVNPSENFFSLPRFNRRNRYSEEILFVLDEEKNIVFASEGAQKLLSVTEGKGFLKTITSNLQISLTVSRTPKTFDVTTQVMDLRGERFQLTTFRENQFLKIDREAERLLTIFDHCFELIGLCDPEGRLIEINQSSLRLGNIKREDVVGEFIWNTFWVLHFAHPQYRRKLIESWPRVTAGEFIRSEFTGSLPTGEVRTIDFSLTPVFDSEGVLKFVVPEGRDITDFKKLNSELERLNERLENLNADLEDFAVVVSHDLRQPLQSIAMGAALLNRKISQENSSELSKYFSFISDGVARMNCLLDSILDYSVSTKAAEQKEMVSCRQILSEVLDNLTKLIEESRAQIRMDPLPKIYGHRTQLMRVFQNLISNALKFRAMERPLVVTISARTEVNSWIFSIADTGIGISPEGISKLFRMFSRLNTKEHYPGMGVGLTICKKIIERHRGKIWVESELGQGTIFYFELPRFGQEG